MSKMTQALKPEDIDVVVLCGGLGTRLRPLIGDRPKPMADINGDHFLDICIEYMAKFGFSRFILCIGYKGDYIKNYYSKRKNHLTILFSEEKELLGTAGAIKNAENLIHSDIFLAMNGDSLCPVNIRKFLEFHKNKNAVASIVLTAQEKVADYGVVRVDNRERIVSFCEKSTSKENGFTNGGIYLFQKKILSYIPEKTKYSLEYDLFPFLIKKNIYGFLSEKKVIDIGTPERYLLAQKFFKNMSKDN